MAEERALHDAKLAKMEAEMKMVFQQKVWACGSISFENRLRETRGGGFGCFTEYRHVVV